MDNATLVDFDMEVEKTSVILFEGKEIRAAWHKSQWFVSVVDLIAALTESKKPSRYWSELRKNIQTKEGYHELFVKIEQLKMPSKDSKRYLTDMVDVTTMLRIIRRWYSSRTSADSTKEYSAN